MVSIISISETDIYKLAGLAGRADAEGFLFVQRTIDEWHSGKQRFSDKGEGLWQILVNGQLVGIGGLSRDPYLNDELAGRVRHVFILPEFRNKGYGKQLLRHIINTASRHFKVLTLFTENPAAALVYEHLSFRPVTEHKITHRLDLTGHGAY
ncbi:MAG TPA: GNAT family N-acetyltransferase [Mucilaginibacter sp.]|nr:GNAT family N-acetyltransferase [Mucilaginibacter sp.]